MRRREFLSGAMTVPLLAQAGKNMSASLPNARWLESGLIDAGGSHEGYLFVTRRGGERLDAHDAYERTQSEELIVRLKSQGIEVFHTHLYKGSMRRTAGQFCFTSRSRLPDGHPLRPATTICDICYPTSEKRRLQMS